MKEGKSQSEMHYEGWRLPGGFAPWSQFGERVASSNSLLPRGEETSEITSAGSSLRFFS